MTRSPARAHHGLTLTILLLHAAHLPAQPAPTPAFEVVSIKPSTADPGSSGVTTSRGRISMQNVTLKRCVRSAHGVEDSQILGGPKWLDEDRYYIEARAPGPAGDHDLMIMLQAMLADRFKLAFHRETRTFSGYALVLGKGGLKAKPSAPGAASSTNTTRRSIDAVACTMERLAQKLSDTLRAPVADLTALAGAFDFKLEWTPDDLQPPADAATALSILVALQEQLGLKLESRKVPTEVLVIDHADKPSEN